MKIIKPCDQIKVTRNLTFHKTTVSNNSCKIYKVTRRKFLANKIYENKITEINHIYY